MSRRHAQVLFFSLTLSFLCPSILSFHLYAPSHSTHENFLPCHVSFPLGFFNSRGQFNIAVLTPSPFFFAQTPTPMFLTSPDSQLTSGQFSSCPIPTADNLVPREGLWKPRMCPASGSSPAFRLTAQSGWGSQGLDSGVLEYGEVSFSLASSSESKTTNPCPTEAAKNTPFRLSASHARELRRVQKAQAFSILKGKN